MRSSRGASASRAVVARSSGSPRRWLSTCCGGGSTAIDARVRAFVAVLIPADVQATLGSAIDELRPVASGVAWVPASNLHLTLKFLGHVETARLDEVRGALAEAVGEIDPFDVGVEGLGAFPSATRPRVIWAGVAAGAAALVDLAQRVEHRLGPRGFPPEDRAFAPHVTLGRIREPRRLPALTEELRRAAERAFGRFRVGRVSLMRSDLSPRGARYTELAAVPVGSPASG